MSAQAITLAKLPGGFIRDCEECGVDVGEYNPRLRSLTCTPDQLADLKDRAGHYAGGSLDAAPLWMRPAAKALLRAIEKAEAQPQPIKSVQVSAKALSLCAVKAEFAHQLGRDETAALMAWCDCQAEDLWMDMSLQEILNVYRASAEYDTWSGWASTDRTAAHKAWNAAVIDPGNRMVGELL